MKIVKLVSVLAAVLSLSACSVDSARMDQAMQYATEYGNQYNQQMIQQQNKQVTTTCVQSVGGTFINCYSN